MLRKRVVEWLNSQDDVTDVRPVQIWLHSFWWQGATFIRGGEQVYYLVGDRPIHNDPICYLLQSDNLDDGVLDRYEWFIGGYVEEPVDKEAHPFGNHWILVPWIIKDAPESHIDDYADEIYKRETLIVKEFP